MPVEMVTLSRDCNAIQIPSGNKMMLQKGTNGRITQSLGGSYTLVIEDGQMVRIDGENADAIGKPIPESVKNQAANQSLPMEKQVWNQLRTIYDPEIPINIVDLGLIYEMKIAPFPGSETEKEVDIKMTLTAPGCGMGEALKRDAQNKLEKIPGIKKVNVELVWEPVWDQSKMSEAAKLQLGL